MKKEFFIGMMLCVAGCSNGRSNGSAVGAGAPAVNPKMITSASHKTTDCPAIRGEYTSDGEATTMIKIEDVDGVVLFSIGDDSVVVDNKSRPLPDDSKMTYTAACKNGRLVMMVSREGKQLGSSAFKLLDNGALSVESAARDPKDEDNGTIIWSPKKTN